MSAACKFHRTLQPRERVWAGVHFLPYCLVGLYHHINQSLGNKYSIMSLYCCCLYKPCKTKFWPHQIFGRKWPKIYYASNTLTHIRCILYLYVNTVYSKLKRERQKNITANTRIYIIMEAPEPHFFVFFCFTRAT